MVNSDIFYFVGETGFARVAHTLRHLLTVSVANKQMLVTSKEWQ